MVVRMDSVAHLQLSQLLGASDTNTREAAWEDLIARHTRLLLAVARSFGGGQDEAMERYSYILEKLRDADFHRLRAFDPEAGASFSTWLSVASRRLCLDHHRTLYGRARATQEAEHSTALRALRRCLADATVGDVDADVLPDSGRLSVDVQAVIAERDAVLRAELARLTPRERLLLALRFHDELSASRIAKILGYSTPFNVYRQLNALLRRLRAALELRGIDGVDG